MLAERRRESKPSHEQMRLLRLQYIQLYCANVELALAYRPTVEMGRRLSRTAARNAIVEMQIEYDRVRA